MSFVIIIFDLDKHKASWLYMSRLAATKEYAFMEILYARGFPTPVQISHNRHVVAMSRISGKCSTV